MHFISESTMKIQRCNVTAKFTVKLNTSIQQTQMIKQYKQLYQISFWNQFAMPPFYLCWITNYDRFYDIFFV